MSFVLSFLSGCLRAVVACLHLHFKSRYERCSYCLLVPETRAFTLSLFLLLDSAVTATVDSLPQVPVTQTAWIIQPPIITVSNIMNTTDFGVQPSTQSLAGAYDSSSQRNNRDDQIVIHLNGHFDGTIAVPRTAQEKEIWGSDTQTSARRVASKR